MPLRILRWLGPVVILGVCIVLDYRILTEAYGDGPPYYGRTVNMDKWTSPLLPLLVVNGLGAAATAVLSLLGRGRRGS
jgi:hypothetical protein